MRDKAGMKFDCIFEETLDFIDIDYTHLNKTIRYEQRQHGTCKTCKNYNPYRDQFSYGYRSDGYCKSPIATSEGNAYINCHDEWYCANYEKAGEKE